MRDTHPWPANPPLTAREAALEALMAAGRPPAHGTVEEELRARVGALDGRDRALARELASGVVRRRASLDAIIEAFSRSRPPERVVREILRIAIYQLLFLDRIPDHAATHSAVEAVKHRSPRAAGYCNGILRTVIRNRRLAAATHPRAFVVSSDRGIGVEGVPVPDAELDLAGNLSLRYSYPRALVERWLERQGRDRTEALLMAGNQSPRLAIWVNPTRLSRELFLARLDEEGLDAEPGRWADTVVMEQGVEVSRLPGFADGDVAVQGEAAQRAAHLLADGQSADGRAVRIVDLCAAPGGKAAHALALALPAAIDPEPGDEDGSPARKTHVAASDESLEVEMVCVDVDAERLGLVKDIFQRLLLPIPALVQADARVFRLPEGEMADAVFVDAPCSNTGVLSRRLEARWRFEPASLSTLAATSTGLLSSGLELLAPGGRLVYSTCSLEPEENQEVVQSVLSVHPEARLVSEELLEPPEHHGDGGYFALIERTIP